MTPMQNDKPSIFIRQLTLVGKRKNYVVQFSEGVNVIYGDSATGKSSVLECINYLLGSSKFIYDREIEASVNFIMMEVFLNGRAYVIKRNIYKPSESIEVYPTTFELLDTVFPKKLTPSFGVESGPDGYFSDFLMEALNVPNVRMRQAPSKADSNMVRLSFRDLFKYCYLKQDDVGSKALLGAGGYALEAKNKETFKYIFNLLDTNISDVQGELAELSVARNRLKNKYDAVSDFLRETEFDSEMVLSDEDLNISLQETAIREQLAVVNSKMVADNQNYAFLKETLLELVGEISLAEKDKSSSESSVERYIRLKNDYQNDIQKLKSIRLAMSVIGEPNESFSCPLCESTVQLSEIKEQFSIDQEDRAAQEVNTLTRRIRDLDVLVQSERDKQSRLVAHLVSLKDDRDRARRMLDEEAAQMITPYLAERDGLARELAKLEEKRKQLANSLKIRNQQKSIFSAILDQDDRIQAMQDKLNLLKSKAPSLQEVMSCIADHLSKYLRHVKIKDQRDVSISNRTFLPILRGRDYREMTSGGLRTILSIGYFLSVLEASTFLPTNIPAFLMIDTVGKYLGKTQSKYQETNIAEDRREELSDPAKYQNMYTYMFDLAKRAKDKGIVTQIILVDNDIPPQIHNNFAEFIVARFNSEGTDGLTRGLIDDAYLFES